MRRKKETSKIKQKIKQSNTAHPTRIYIYMPMHCSTMIGSTVPLCIIIVYVELKSVNCYKSLLLTRQIQELHHFVYMYMYMINSIYKK